MASGYVVDGESHIGMQFNDQETIIRVVKNYNISRSVDYKVHELEPMTFYCTCKHYDSECQWLVRVSFKKDKDFWEIKKYNSPHTCPLLMLSWDHTKLDSNMISKCIEALVRASPSFKVKNVIAKIQNWYGHTTTYQKAQMTKQKAIERVYGS